MRKRSFFIFLNVLLLLPGLALSQTKIKGIGIFKIGETTTSVVTEIAKGNLIKIKPSNTADRRKYNNGMYEKRTNHIYEISYEEDSIKSENPVRFVFQPSSIPGVKIFFIDYYEVAEIPLEEIYIFFYRDTLYKIHATANKALSNAMKIKYGEGSIKREIEKITCTNAFRDFKEETVSITTSWKTNVPNIHATLNNYDFITNDCKKINVSYLEIENFKLVNKFWDIELTNKKKAKELEDQKKRAKLKDF